MLKKINKIFKIFVAGHTGLVGSAVVRRLKYYGYKNIYSCKDEEHLVSKMNLLIKESGPNFLEVKVKPGSRKNLGRPTINPKENKKDFMNFVKKLSKVCIIIQ